MAGWWSLSVSPIVIYGSDLVRLQKALLRFGFWVVGLSIIYQIHFASQYSIKAVVIGIGGALVFILGLGLQRTLTNLFSGFDLQADKVFAKGDMIQIGAKGVEGGRHERRVAQLGEIEKSENQQFKGSK